MDYRPLGRTDLRVSAICLGTMTWGNQNDEAEGHQQLDYALDRGVNFIDTAEMYAVPATKKTYGTTETIIGTWLKDRPDRDKIVIATKIVGPGARFDFLRGGTPRLDKKNIDAAIDDSLRRLRTDYVDLYQLHWPNRSASRFGQRGFVPIEGEDFIDPAETLDALEELIAAGKVRHIGVSNETGWGLMRFLSLAEMADRARIVSVQNPYNLLNRTFEASLAEIAMREQCGLLAYSPLAAGFLTGKYIGGVRPAGSRMAVFNQTSRYETPNGQNATEKYVAVAKRHGLDPAQMAIAFVAAQPFTTSAIIGSTSMEQLKTDIGAAELTLDEAVLKDIEAVQDDLPNPCP